MVIFDTFKKKLFFEAKYHRAMPGDKVELVSDILTCFREVLNYTCWFILITFSFIFDSHSMTTEKPPKLP